MFHRGGQGRWHVRLGLLAARLWVVIMNRELSIGLTGLPDLAQWCWPLMPALWGSITIFVRLGLLCTLCKHLGVQFLTLCIKLMKDHIYLYRYYYQYYYWLLIIPFPLHTNGSYHLIECVFYSWVILASGLSGFYLLFGRLRHGYGSVGLSYRISNSYGTVAYLTVIFHGYFSGLRFPFMKVTPWLRFDMDTLPFMLPKRPLWVFSLGGGGGGGGA